MLAVSLDDLLHPVASPDDPRLADYRVVKERDTLAARGVFIAEGRLVVERLLSPACRFAVRSLLLLNDRLDAMRPFVEPRLRDLHGAGATVFLADRAVMDAIVGFRFHQGCLGVGVTPPPEDRRFSLGALLAHGERSPGPLVILEDLVDLDNVGACFRNGAALGASGVALSPRCASPLYRKAIRTSMGHSLMLPFAVLREWPGDLRAISRAGFETVALTPSPDALSLGAFARPGGARRAALLVGTEGEGLSKGALAAADHRVRIPMATGVDSINVATALAIALHHVLGVDAPAGS